MNPPKAITNMLGENWDHHPWIRAIIGVLVFVPIGYVLMTWVYPLATQELSNADILTTLAVYGGIVLVTKVLIDILPPKLADYLTKKVTKE